MDPFFENDDQNSNIETRWDQIERRHLNSASVFERSEAAAEICKDLLENKEFISNNHLKTMFGDKSQQFCLDPNLVMELRHSRVKRRQSSTSTDKRRAKSFTKMRMYSGEKMLELNREIERYKKNLEQLRPKSNDLKAIKPVSSVRSDGNAQYKMLDKMLTNGISDDEPTYDELSSQNDLLALTKCENGIEPHNGAIAEVPDKHSTPFSSPRSIPIPSECLKDETFQVNGISVHGLNETERHRNFFGYGSMPSDFTETVFPKAEVHQASDNFELIIRPTIMVNIQDSMRMPQEQSPESPSDYTDLQRRSKIAVNQHMSIVVKKLSNEIIAEKSTSDMSESTEGSNIIREICSQKSHDDFILLQRCFLHWVHFNTIEKLKRRNPAQTRLQKMEAFLRNITLERKKAMNKLRRADELYLTKRHPEDRSVVSHCADSPRMLLKTFNNKLKTQQDIIELQKIKLQRQERIISEMKLSKLLDATSDSEAHLRAELQMVAKNAYPNARTKAKCLQIAGNLKGDEDDSNSDLRATGMKAPKFLIEMQARALERQMRHQEAQQRREALDREKEAMRLAAEDEKRQMDDQAKRERIKEYWRKRREEKELEERKAIEKMRFLTNLERAKTFHRFMALKAVIEKFKNIVRWKNRNLRVCKELRHRIICREFFNKWRQITQKIWTERKLIAENCYNRHCVKMAWSAWQECYLIMQSKKLLAEDWYHLRLTGEVFRVWERVTAQTRLVMEVKQKQAEAHFNWYMKWKVVEHWRRLHAILKIERETESRRERWRSKVFELIPDYMPNSEFI